MCQPPPEYILNIRTYILTRARAVVGLFINFKINRIGQERSLTPVGMTFSMACAKNREERTGEVGGTWALGIMIMGSAAYNIFLRLLK